MRSGNPAVRKAFFILAVISLLFLLQPKGGTWAWINNIRWLYLFLVTFLITYITTPVAIKLAECFNIMDNPDDKRKLQEKPIPRIGGLAVFTAVIVCSIRNFQFSPELTGLLAGSSVIYVTGLIDDIRPLSATVRIIAQLTAGLILIKSGICIDVTPATLPYAHLFDAALTLFWLIGITNAINFLDGIDGLASSMVAMCALLFFLIALPTHQNHLSYLSISLAGACSGFLIFNWQPARVYLGDAGSTFIGFFIAGLAIMGTWANNNPMIALSTPVLILGIPIFDMIYTTVSRIKNGSVKTFRQWLEFAARDHFHHRLLNLRLSVKQTVFFILLVNLCLGLNALVMRDTGTNGSLLILAESVIFIILIVILMLLGRQITNVPEKSS